MLRTVLHEAHERQGEELSEISLRGRRDSKRAIRFESLSGPRRQGG
jgi:hypothetical protein